MGVEVILKKKVYNPSLDSGPGIVVFDRSTRKIWVGGECYSSEVMDISYNTTTKVLLITKFDGTAITLNFSTFETTGNRELHGILLCTRQALFICIRIHHRLLIDTEHFVNLQ